MRNKDLSLKDIKREPIICFGGVISDFIECLYGKVANQECVPDITIVGDGEYTVPLLLQNLYECKKNNKTKKDFLKLGHTLSRDEHFERDGYNKKFSWWYEPDLYDHVYKFNSKTGYNELDNIIRKKEYEYAVPPGKIKRAVMRDLDFSI